MRTKWMRSPCGSAAAMLLVALVVGTEAGHHEVGVLDEGDGLEELAQAAATHDLADVQDDAPLRRQAELRRWKRSLRRTSSAVGSASPPSTTAALRTTASTGRPRMRPSTCA